jgi:hypothetical protein
MPGKSGESASDLQEWGRGSLSYLPISGMGEVGKDQEVKQVLEREAEKLPAS